MVKKIKLLFVSMILVLFLVGCGSSGYNMESTDALANCLADKNVKEYGAFWCPNCAKQEKMFGKSHAIIKSRGVYVECDPRCDVSPDDLPIACREIVGQTKLCLDKKVEKYPHWEFSDGSVLIGVQELNILAEKAGCSFP